MRFLLLIVVFCSVKLVSQNNSQSIFTLKPALGLNGCQVHGDNYSGYNKLGAFGGIAVNAQLKNKASLELGFYFSQKGSKHLPNIDKGDYSFYLLNLNYLDMPLLFKFNVNPKYFLTLGPSIAYLIDYKENINYTDFTGLYHFNKFETGINIGLGRKILKERCLLEIRCSNSITSVRDYGVTSNVFYPNPVARFFNKGFYNNILTLMVSYNIAFKKKSEAE